uniref:Uncharacterized protein n=1 Tax=Aegilops tauschii TaxID=37682 RepID=N1QWV8_AEGTA
MGIVDLWDLGTNLRQIKGSWPCTAYITSFSYSGTKDNAILSPKFQLQQQKGSSQPLLFTPEVRFHPDRRLTEFEYNLGPPCPPPHIQILPDDLLVEILMRLPPEPIYLFRASHVCKHWRSLIHDARFLCRFHEFHRGTPPVLGFFSNQPSFPFFVSITNTFAGSAVGKIDHDYLSVLDCRHGRALLKCKCCNELLVLDLVTGDTIWLPYPTQLPKQATYNGAVLCVAGHDNCHSCPVLVVLVFSNKVDFITAGCVYSSETGVWGEITSIHMPDSFVVPLPTVLVGNTLYWLLDNDHIIQFDLDKHRLDLIEEVPHSYCKQVIIMPAEDGLVGFAGVDGSSLHLWSRVGSIDGGVPWTRRIIDFEELLGPETSLCHPLLVGYAEDADVIFICADTSVYMIHLKSMMKIERWNELDIVFPIFPYTRFYSPVKALGAYCLAAEPSSFSAGRDHVDVMLSNLQENAVHGDEREDGLLEIVLVGLCPKTMADPQKPDYVFSAHTIGFNPSQGLHG